MSPQQNMCKPIFGAHLEFVDYPRTLKKITKKSNVSEHKSVQNNGYISRSDADQYIFVSKLTVL